MPRNVTAVVAAPGRVETVETDAPEPGPGMARVRLEGSGLCGSDLAVWEGRPWFQYPREPGAPGHEGWGTVDAVGEGVSRVQVGDRVTGLFGRAYARYDLAREQDLVVLPPALERVDFPGEPFACAVNAFRRCGVREGDKVAVVGVGFLGAVLAALAAGAGADVTAVSRRGFALKVAEQVGAQRVSTLDDAWDLAGPDGRFDVVVEATGKQQPLDLAAKLARVRGRLVVAGYHQDGPRAVDMQLWNWRGLDVVNAHERAPAVYLDGMREAVRLVEEGKLDPRPLLTHRFPLADLQKAFVMMRDRPDGFLKAVVRP